MPRRLHEWFAGLHRRRRVLRSFFDVSRGRARVTVRGGRDARLVAPRSATGRGALGAASTDARCSRVLELLAHAIELRGVIRTEPTARFGRMGAMTSTTTTHRPLILTHYPTTCIEAPDQRPGGVTRCQGACSEPLQMRSARRRHAEPLASNRLVYRAEPTAAGADCATGVAARDAPVTGGLHVGRAHCTQSHGGRRARRSASFTTIRIDKLGLLVQCAHKSDRDCGVYRRLQSGREPN
jgi:hypothetical protein